MAGSVIVISNPAANDAQWLSSYRSIRPLSASVEQCRSQQVFRRPLACPGRTHGLHQASSRRLPYRSSNLLLPPAVCLFAYGREIPFLFSID